MGQGGTVPDNQGKQWGSGGEQCQTIKVSSGARGGTVPDNQGKQWGRGGTVPDNQGKQWGRGVSARQPR